VFFVYFVVGKGGFMAQDHFPQQAAPSKLLDDIRRMIEETRSKVAVTVNAGLTLLYWRIGRRIAQEILKGKRAEYGKEIVPTVSAQLVPEFGTGLGVRNLFRMIKFAEGRRSAESRSCFP